MQSWLRVRVYLSPLPLSSVTLSLEAKLHLLHSYMTVKWITLPCEMQVKGM